MADRFHTVELSDPVLERDGLRLATVKSRALGRRADVTFWVPQAERIGTLLILLHGVYGSHWVWSGKGGAHRTAQRLLDEGAIAPLVIAMPGDGLERDGSGYLTWPGGCDVERWIVEEVPELARIAAPALDPGARIAIAGLSMGGFGALRLGAKYASRFSAIAAHSAIVNADDLADFVQEPISEYLACASREELDAAYWMLRCRDALPPLQFDCGLDDALLASNRRLHRELTDAGIVHGYSEHPGGHEWSYWERHLADTLRHVHRHCHREEAHESSRA